MNTQRLLRSVAQLKSALHKKAAVPRHRWTSEQLRKLISRYRKWSQEAGPDKLFKLKDFILSNREDMPFFAELDDEAFYERVKRTLYRALAQSGTAWRHAGKTQLTKVVDNPEINQILSELAQHGVGISTDGAVLLIFPAQYYTHQPDEGYFVPTVGHAITHLKKIIATLQDSHQEVVEEAKKVVPLLRQFAEAWRMHPEREEIFDPNIRSKLEEDEYTITQDPNNPTQYEVLKKDGTRYYCDAEEHTCTCPAGASGRTCKHLNNLLFK